MRYAAVQPSIFQLGKLLSFQIVTWRQLLDPRYMLRKGMLWISFHSLAVFPIWTTNRKPDALHRETIERTFLLKYCSKLGQSANHLSSGTHRTPPLFSWLLRNPFCAPKMNRLPNRSRDCVWTRKDLPVPEPPINVSGPVPNGSRSPSSRICFRKRCSEIQKKRPWAIMVDSGKKQFDLVLCLIHRYRPNVSLILDSLPDLFFSLAPARHRVTFCQTSS